MGLADRDELARAVFEMDQQSFDYYHRKAAEVSERYLSVDSGDWVQRFKEAFPAGGGILDVGCGSGRDLAVLLSRGYEAHGTEAFDDFRAESLRAFLQIANQLVLPHPARKR